MLSNRLGWSWTELSSASGLDVNDAFGTAGGRFHCIVMAGILTSTKYIHIRIALLCVWYHNPKAMDTNFSR